MDTLLAIGIGVAAFNLGLLLGAAWQAHWSRAGAELPERRDNTP